MPNSITGINDDLISHLETSISNAKSVRIIVAFLMESGARLIARQLATAVERGVSVKILTGIYMSVTEPSAIYYLWDKLGTSLDIRFYDDNVRSFHPKAYLFEGERDSELYVGSSNISKSALTCGVEWNYRLIKSLDPESYDNFSSTFDNLFEHHSNPVTDELLKEYAIKWKKPELVKVEALETIRLAIEPPEPYGAQVEALYYLKRAREEGVSKGLVIAATGVGKTYLAAFDSISYSRILFVAHRDEILKQAEETFRNTCPESKIGYFNGNLKETQVNICLATIQTLGRETHLQTIKPDFFEYIIIDEFHHAAADSYNKLLNYFKPKFLLGLTATPFRMDNRDIYTLCDDNVIYEIYLKDAINRGLLVPFNYFGVFDPTNYSQVEIRNGQYVIEQLEKELSQLGRAHLILDKYRYFAGCKTIGFCVSISHAEYMAQYFVEQGVKACSVHSGNKSQYTMERTEAIDALENRKIKVIFCVDLFNEGVDIPTLDTVMFLRPTESFTIFLQQLGRGLRKHEDKQHLTVLDFIGNYRRAHYIPALLSGDNPLVSRPGQRPQDIIYPDNCSIQFDFQVLDLFVELAKNDPLKKRMVDQYFWLKEELGHRPSRTEVYEGTDLPFREFLKEGWLRFLDSVKELTKEEQGWLDTPAEEFLREVEKTAFAKAYKIPTIGSLLKNDGSMRSQVNLSEIAQQFFEFYHNNPLHQRDLCDKSNSDWRSWDLNRFAKLARENPIHFLSKGELFYYDEVNKNFGINQSITPYLGKLLASHLADILEYRRLDFFKKRYRTNEL